MVDNVPQLNRISDEKKYGREIADYIISKFKGQFPEFEDITDKYDENKYIYFKSKTPNKFGDYPQVEMLLTEKGLQIKTTDVPYPDDVYDEDPKVKREDLMEDRHSHFPYYVWDLETDTDREFWVGDKGKAYEIINKAFEALKINLNERLKV